VSTTVITARGWSKTFTGTRVLRDVDLDIGPGEVRALLGQNGSGKSTFIKILSGYHAPDPGASLSVCGEAMTLPLAPGGARRHNIAVVHQDLGLIDTASVLENLKIGRLRTSFGRPINWRRERAEAQRLLDRFGLAVRADTPVSALREVERATLALIRALDELATQDSGLLVLDEPTAYLPRDGIGRLFDAVRDVAARGIGVLFVTHRLEEVRGIADTVTVLRDGALVASGPVDDFTDTQLITHIVGRELAELYPEQRHASHEAAVTVEGLRSPMLEDVSFSIGRGEIIGATGVIGMGWEELPYVLAGARPAFGGTLAVNGNRVDIASASVRKTRRLGVALLPANRGRDGVVADATVIENATLAVLKAHCTSFGRLRRGHERRRVEELLTQFDVRPRDPDRMMGTLSGGNQQKVVIAKWLEAQTQVFLMHEPTQGVDVGARRQIFEVIRGAAESGASLLFASSEYEDLANMCDRVLIFRNGRITSELSGTELTEERIAEQSFRQVAA
jgi:ribose transport system ATP-binding protein